MLYIRHSSISVGAVFLIPPRTEADKTTGVLSCRAKNMPQAYFLTPSQFSRDNFDLWSKLQKVLRCGGVLFVISWMNWGAMKSACGRINPLTWMKSLSRWNPTSSGYGGRFHITRGLPRISSERSEDFIRFCGFHHRRWFHFLPPSYLLFTVFMV